MAIFNLFNKNNRKNKNNINNDNNDINKTEKSFNNNLNNNTNSNGGNRTSFDDEIDIDSYSYEESKIDKNNGLNQSYYNKSTKTFINLDEGDGYESYDIDSNSGFIDEKESSDFEISHVENNFNDMEKEKVEVKAKTLEERYEEDFIESKAKLNRSVKSVAAIILILFIGLISYLVYFQVVKAPELKLDGGNTRTIEARNKVKRGSIIDRHGHILSESILNQDGKQERVYHGSIAFSNILGYQSNIYSVSGLESSLDSVLTKTFDFKSFFTMDFIKNIIDGDITLNSKPQGHNVKITLDSGIQNLAYRLLNGKKGSVVALNPKTGEVIAMVSSPGFDPSDLDKVMDRIETDKEYSSLGPLVNKAKDNYYAPGSTFKAVTLASAISNIPGIADKTFNDQGEITFTDGSKLPNLDSHAYGEISLQEAFTYSSNVVFGELALQLSNAQLKDTSEDFGFNRQVNSLGLYPVVSVFPTHKKTDEGLMAQSGIGQGQVLASPLQMAMVASAIANNGVLMQPQIVSEIIDKNGYLVDEYTAKVFSTPMNNEVAGKVKKYLATNVSSGSSTYNSLVHINGAGKTGTAEFSTEKGFRINSWFIGFAPVEDPKIAIAVLVEDLENTNDNLSSRNATPMAAQIMEEYINKN